VEVTLGRRIFEVMRETFWLLALAVIALFAFFVALGALSPGEAVTLSIVVAVLCALWVVHAVLEGRKRDTRDPAVIRARERRGF
jgi:membrane protein implicated in regulation of membrane protease activity